MSNARKRVHEIKQLKTLLMIATRDLASAIASPSLKAITNTLPHRWFTIRTPKAHSWAIADRNWNRRRVFCLKADPPSINLKRIFLLLKRLERRGRRVDHRLFLGRNNWIRRYANNRDQLKGPRYEKVRRERHRRLKPRSIQWTRYRLGASPSP